MPTKDPIKRALNQRRKYWRDRKKALARKARYREKHREELRVRNMQYIEKNREAIRERRKNRVKKGIPARQMQFSTEKLFADEWKKRRKEIWLKTLYGITPEHLEATRIQQGNRCPGCKKSFDEPGVRMTIDHNHKTNKFRALLCNHCNLAIGHAFENPGLLRKLAGYLRGGWGENTDSGTGGTRGFGVVASLRAAGTYGRIGSGAGRDQPIGEGGGQ